MDRRMRHRTGGSAMGRAAGQKGAALRQQGALRRALLVGAPAAALLSRPVIAAAEIAGYVEEVRGQVTAELAAQRRVLVPRGDIFLGDDVASAEHSRAELQLGHDTSLRLGANARVRIDRFIVNAGGVLTLEDGPLLLDKAPGTGGALFIRGQFGLIAIRGTRNLRRAQQRRDRHLCRAWPDRCHLRRQEHRAADWRRHQPGGTWSSSDRTGALGRRPHPRCARQRELRLGRGVADGKPPPPNRARRRHRCGRTGHNGDHTPACAIASGDA